MYRISAKTLAIIPHYDLSYQAKVIETEQEVLSTETPLTIIRENCIHYGASYEGRKQSVRHHLDFHQKTPIPIHPPRHMYAFPTKAAKSYDCCWILFEQVSRITSQDDPGKSIIHFKNGHTLHLNESVYSMKKQYDRTGMCAVVFQTLC